MKQKTVYVCSECGGTAPRWTGKCPECGQWNTMVEQAGETARSASSRSGMLVAQERAVSVTDIEQTNYSRFLTGIPELDRVLGGGVVPGSAVLVGGEPGIGKSTLLLQMCRTVQTDGQKILYVSGEESKEQIGMRAQRIGALNPGLMVLSATDIDAILDCMSEQSPRIVIVDSIQTMCSDAIDSAPGSLSQVKECALRLTRYAKSTSTAVFIVGHVNKEGAIAGPKVLEHMVDAVLYFEGDKRLMYRIVRTVKNRFGPTSELGVFEMAQNGLIGVDNPSALFLSARPEEVSGACVVCVMEGSRPILAEIQALTSTTSFPVPRRVSSGIDYNKLCLIVAVLEKRAGFNFSTSDAYINVAGGLRLDDPAADLAVALALASSLKDIVIDTDVVAVGEIGLAGEVRPVADVERRIKEGARLGLKRFVISDKSKLGKVSSDVEIIMVKDVKAAVSAVRASK